MIRSSALLTLVAMAVLVAGVFSANLGLIYASIAVSILAALTLGVGVLLRRRELFGGAAAGDVRPGWAAAGAAGAQAAVLRPAGPGSGDLPATKSGTGAGAATGAAATAGDGTGEREIAPAEPKAAEAADERDGAGAGKPTGGPGAAAGEAAGGAAGAGAGKPTGTPEVMPGAVADAGGTDEAAGSDTEDDEAEPAMAETEDAGAAAAAEDDEGADDSDGAGADAPEGSDTGEGAGRAPGGTTPMDDEVTIVPGVARYHRRGCILIRFLGDGDLETTTRREAEAAGSVPCKACQPDKPDPSA